MISSPDRLAVYGMAGLVVLLTSAAVTLLWTEVQTRQMNARIGQALAADDPASASFAGLVGILQRFGEWLRRFYKPASLEHLRGLIEASGFNPHRTLPLLIAGKFLLTAAIMTILLLAACLSGSAKIGVLILGLGGIIGVAGPEWVLALVRRRFTADLQRGTPDALDLLVVCSEAGMGLESALERVSLEMQHSNRAMASVLSSLLDDLRVLPNRRDAFTNLGSRSGVDGLKRFGTMLSQSLQYGTPMSNALRAVAEELRRDRMNKLEEKAIKLPAKLIFPLILFIMPSLYIVLLGPSFMQLYDSLKLVRHAVHH